MIFILINDKEIYIGSENINFWVMMEGDII